MSASLPIGVFDSGIGGLTVLKALLHALPNESTFYLGDTARVPYGTKSPEVVTRYSERCAGFLLDRGIKALVVACNTASSAALPTLQHRLSVPVIGVIEPGAQVAVDQTKSGRIGVIGTPGTIRSGAYQRAIVARRPDAHVVAKPCPLFVPLADEGWLHGDVPRLVAKQYLEPMAKDGLDTLVLGCTHYPLLRDVIAEAVGPGVVLVDSAQATAATVSRLLAAQGLLRTDSEPTQHHSFVTDVPDRFYEVAERFLGRPVKSVEQVDL